MGYREIDCLLYAAGLKFNFNEMDKLLAEGANPYIDISSTYPADIALEKDPSDLYNEAVCLFDDVSSITCDLESYYGICDCWKDGFYGKETIISSDLIREFFQGAGCQLVFDTIRKHHPQPL